MDGCFSEDYIEARAKFIQAAQAAGATITRFALAERGPDGDELSTDVAWLGPPDASRALITISGTHGVEGFSVRPRRSSGCVVLRRPRSRKVLRRCIFMRSTRMDLPGSGGPMRAT